MRVLPRFPAGRQQGGGGREREEVSAVHGEIRLVVPADPTYLISTSQMEITCTEINGLADSGWHLMSGCRGWWGLGSGEGYEESEPISN